MSGTFTGFSEDDIKKLKSGKQSLEDNKLVRPVMKAKRRTEQNIIKQKTTQNQKTEMIHPIPEDAKLSMKVEKITNQEVLNQPVASVTETNGKNENVDLEEKCSTNAVIISTNKIEKKVIDLDEFQARQKRIEEQNRRRKELLSKALADRTKQTEEEARRLKEIQNEFKKLDAILSDDVAILRHQIEIASLDFMEAQKRYHKIEKEFLAAKLNLHQKLEKKEMLTEHLCAIIEKNEERKAEKLNELMARLTIDGKTIPETIESETKILQNGVKIEETCGKENIDDNQTKN